MKTGLGVLHCIAIIAATGPALAADLQPPAAKRSTTITLEASPEFYAQSKSGSYSQGDLADYYLKLGLSHTFESGLSLGGAIDHTIRVPDTNGESSSFNKAEINLGYKMRLMDSFTLTPTGTLGYAFGDEPKIDPQDAYRDAAYFAIQVAVDYKLTSELTWNVIAVRYRDAFDYTWKTPKIQTGVTYSIDSANAIYANVGKSWKNTGDGYAADKINVAFGWKYSF